VRVVLSRDRQADGRSRLDRPRDGRSAKNRPPTWRSQRRASCTLAAALAGTWATSHAMRAIPSA